MNKLVDFDEVPSTKNEDTYIVHTCRLNRKLIPLLSVKIIPSKMVTYSDGTMKQQPKA